MSCNTMQLRWDHFETNAPNTFRNLWNDQDFVDVTLATADDKQIRAHKVILSSCSQFFRNILLKNPHQNPLLYLKGIRYKELLMEMQFIYLGQCEVGQYELQDFLTTGKDLEVGGLMEYVNLKYIEEPVVENGTHDMQAPQESDSNYTDIDDTTRVLSPQNNEREDFLPSYQHEGRRLGCNECNAGFAGASGLLFHKRSIHDGMTYDCNQCNYKATQQVNLTRHKQSKHEGIRYGCDQCDSSFIDKSYLSMHKQSKHQGIRYYCDQCDSNFTLQNSLTKHKQSKH